MYKRVIVFLFVLVFVSCENKVALDDMDLSIERHPVVCAVGRGDSIYIGVYLSKTIYERHETMVKAYDVKLFKNNEWLNIPYREQLNTSSEDTSYWYIYSDTSITEQNNYKLTFIADNFEPISVESRMHETRKITLKDIVRLPEFNSENRYELTFLVDDPEKTNNYYEFLIWGQKNQFTEKIKYWYEGSPFEIYQPFVFSDKRLRNNELKIVLIEPASARVNLVFFYLMQVDSAAYFAQETAKHQPDMMLNTGSYAFEPINVYSTVHNGFGDFRTYSEPCVDTILLTQLFPN